MKKIMYFAAALLVLAGCQSSQEARENAPAEMVTIKGRIELPQGPNKIAPQSDWKETTVGGNINFQWELGDSVAVFKASKTSCECEKFKVTSIDNESGIATLAGEALSSGMDEYMVIYPYVEITSDFETASNSLLLKQTYKKDSFEPVIIGGGAENAFTLSIFCPAIHLQLKGAVVLGKIEYRELDADENVSEDLAAQMTFGSGLKLDNTTSTDVVLFALINEDPHGFELSFYDTAGQLIMKKQSTSKLIAGTITPFPELEVKAAPTHAYVDLGLPSGLKWATCNVGATNPEDYGDYFAWGETEPYYSSLSPLTWKTGKEDGYNDEWVLYKYCNGSYDTMTKYCTSTSYGTVDNKTVLESTDDAASVNWGGAWRMPTDAEWTELKNNCTWTWTTLNDVAGYQATSNIEGYTDKSIFLPAAGYFYGTSHYRAGSRGYYWSSSLNTSRSSYGRNLNFDSGNVYMSLNFRFYGQSVRPVCQ